MAEHQSKDSSQVDDLEWEEWDGSSPFLHHCVAGSIAGVAEHVLLYPMDTIKTHMQSYCADCPRQRGGIGTPNPMTLTKSLSPGTMQSLPSSANAGMIRTTFQLLYPSTPTSFHTTGAKPAMAPSLQGTATPETTFVSPKRLLRLFRGVQTMFVGCVPAHALYFSSYELVKSYCLATSGPEGTTELTPLGASAAGATATICHDAIMTPLDTVKQRLQLGHYKGLGHAVSRIYASEGMSAFYRSFPVTLATNVPYGAIMVSVNEGMKSFLLSRRYGRDEMLAAGGGQRFDISVSLISGSVAGFVAGAVTTPLDRVKTRLQTQRLGSVPTMRTRCETGVADCALARMPSPGVKQFNGIGDAVTNIIKLEGIGGLWRGWAPRVMSHTPAVAICWTTYEGVKNWLRVNWGEA